MCAPVAEIKDTVEKPDAPGFCGGNARLFGKDLCSNLLILLESYFNRMNKSGSAAAKQEFFNSIQEFRNCSRGHIDS
jgi:hypothetical protein